MMPDVIKVLLIEDDVAVRIGSEQALQLAGFPVESFESAERVVASIQPEISAIVVSDVKLPGIDGLGLLRHVVDIERDLPVILVTGHGDITMAVQAMREGCLRLHREAVSVRTSGGRGKSRDPRSAG